MTPTPLVLIHGWGMTPKVWNGLRICLSPRSVATPALPGHAGRARVPATLAAWGDALLDDLPREAVLVGWSLGGLIALGLAHRHPDRVAQLILTGTTSCFVSRDAPGDVWEHGVDAATAAGFTKGFAEDPGGTLRRFLALQALGEKRRRSVVHALSTALADTPTDHLATLTDGLHLLAETDLRAHVPMIRQPTLLIHGRQDALMPVGAAEWLAQALPRARLAVFDECGHAPFLSRPEEFARLLEEALLDAS